MEFLSELSIRNQPLFVYGLICLIGGITTSVLSFTTSIEVLGINAFIKPTKFFFSMFFFVWSMGWFLGYLEATPIISIYTWTVISVLSFEIIYILIQASMGSTSHFNNSTAYHSTLWSLMGIAISLMTLFTAYIGMLFFFMEFPELSSGYLWGIRLGILLFVIFAFEGAVMGANMAHTVGGPDGGEGLKFLNWSITRGDLRIAHFIGMHALQVLPLLGYYVFSGSRAIIIAGILYFLVALFVFIQALKGIPLLRMG